MRILLVDDDNEVLKPLCEEMTERKQLDVDWKQVPFEDAAVEIKSFAPDLIVLDLFSGSPSDSTNTGLANLGEIWEQHFLPIVVYSADPSDVSEEPRYGNHPYIRCVKKGSESDLKVLEEIAGFCPLIEMLQRAKTRIELEFSKALRDVSTKAPADSLLSVVERAARRRVAALVDEADPSSRLIEPWEQYVFPPVSGNLRQGDILRPREAQRELAERYRVVLTPSCDLATSGDRRPKVDSVLVARCTDMARALVSMGIEGGKPSRRKDRLQRVLNSGFERHVVPFPELPGLIPRMAADLRSLELIPFDRVAAAYDVVASVDSPFREAIAWAYMQTGARPGLPDRATGPWAREAVDDLSSDGDV